MKQFTSEQMQQARRTDLYSFLLEKYPERFVREGTSIRPKDNHSISIKRGFAGYKDFANDDHGNSVDYLVKHMGFQLVDAVFALIDYGWVIASPDEVPEFPQKTQVPTVEIAETPSFPKPKKDDYRCLFAYLMNRGIAKETIQMLIDKDLIYQDAEHNNIVFVNEERDWGEIRGTYTKSDKSFHGMIINSKHDSCWYFSVCETYPTIAYVCEAAIDAISLYELHRLNGVTEPAFYISIGGVAKQDTIDRIKKMVRVIIAVDNDEAGSECRLRNAELKSIIPTKKDWNDDLLEELSLRQAKAEQNDRNDSQPLANADQESESHYDPYL